MKNNKGITLIALVLTVILMLILVGVVVTNVGHGRLFDHAGKAVKDTEKAQYLEALQIAILESKSLGDIKINAKKNDLFENATFIENTDNGMLFIKVREQLFIFSNQELCYRNGIY